MVTYRLGKQLISLELPDTTKTEINFRDTSFFTTRPVPELFGWRVDDEAYVFIYMELIEGPRLEECWDSLGTMEKSAISDQLSQIMESLRRLEQDPSDQFIGPNHQQSLLDYVFIGQLITGPFSNTKEFNDWLASTYRLRFSQQIWLSQSIPAGMTGGARVMSTSFYSLTLMRSLFGLNIAWCWVPINSTF
ncbi:hypothetical protein BDV27DRAFT_157128 [Aspergillus caelatus]|uniref:Aminoglycoside phosphotransferase domain-containing protein n=1 Tax=Aspergillus caelatus TaxID=61420 RepID=A0A5N7A705_9EURO|nr:uncharacterized protein BDV27DRAFT_157128 [Aspergillus caelatus]KAE8365218.1 hypothetical protein BDV27DRAFT_157128 [Aspergillus caelatus]